MTRNGDWFKVVGGDFGSVKLGGRWKGFACLYCARHRRLLSGRRLQAGESKKAEEVARGRKVLECGGAPEHRLERAQRKEWHRG